MPLLGPTMESRDQVFQRLKPVCVRLTQTTLALNGHRGSIPELEAHLEELRAAISSAKTSGNTLDEKLADYVFFPLSQVLKLSRIVSIRCLEISLTILAVLIQDGWRSRIQPQLVGQILILCTLLASETPTGLASSETTKELRSNALRCLSCLFRALKGSQNAKELFAGEQNLPQVGQTLSTILDALELSDDFTIQIEAIKSLGAFIACINDRELIASFLPGLVSKLTKVLTPKTKQRRHHEVLVRCLYVFGSLLVAVLHDMATPSSDAKYSMSHGAKLKGDARAEVGGEYRNAAADQIKAALTGVYRLRNHERDDVRLSLAKLCLQLLNRCRKTLANTSRMTLETALTIATGFSDLKSEFHSTICAEPDLLALLQDVLHDWVKSLARTMQSIDEHLKIQRLEQIRTGYELLQRSGLNVTLLEREIANALRDSVVVTIGAPKSEHNSAPSVQPVQALDLTLLDNESRNTNFATALVEHRGQEHVMKSMEAFAYHLGQSPSSSDFVAEMARSLQHTQGDAQAAQFWLLYVVAQSASQRPRGIESLLNFGDEDRAIDQVGLEEVYSFSLAILGDSEHQADLHIKSLALRGLALQAQTAGQDFRYELIDALYPVLYTLATPDRQLQRDSITTLNILTKACAYGSTKDLIVSNVDYLTNAVTLKLNAFDVSPQAPQVLLMMVRLAGPSLLPYLEDTVESIFAALEDFHGYPLLVELLFRVLSVMAEEGVKTPQLAITAPVPEELETLLDERHQPTQMTDLIAVVREKVHEDSRHAKSTSTAQSGNTSFPRRPWVDDEESAEDEQVSNREDETMARHGQQAADEEAPPPAPKIYTLLLKITDLTQHFLPSASPSLRASLLGLIHTTVPALARHENSFLPLINTLWPEVTARLDDHEAHVRATALEIISTFCEHAKDFMRGRLTELWPVLVEIHGEVAKEIVASVPSENLQAATKQRQGLSDAALVTSMRSFKQAVMRMHGSPADYSDTSTRLLWNALVRTITTAVEHVSLSPEIFDEALKILEPVLERKDVASAFEKENMDAVWLVKMRTGQIVVPEKPATVERRMWDWAAMSV